MPQKYNFAIIPPTAIVMRAIEMSEWLSAEGTQFVLDGEKLHPHVSLYHVALDPKQIDVAIANVTKSLETQRAFFLTQGPYRAVEDEWIDASYDRDSLILGLHETTITGAKDFRLNIGEEQNRPDWLALSEDQQRNLVATGWTEADDRYVPHLTFARMNTKDAAIASRLPFEDFTFHVERIGLYEMGEHGTCTRLVYEFALKND